MVDLPEGTIFRTVFEERANQIALKFQADERMLRSQYYDYTVPGQLTVTCFETESGKPFVFVLTTKTSETQVEHDVTKELATYDRSL